MARPKRVYHKVDFHYSSIEMNERIRRQEKAYNLDGPTSVSRAILENERGNRGNGNAPTIYLNRSNYVGSRGDRRKFEEIRARTLCFTVKSLRRFHLSFVLLYVRS